MKAITPQGRVVEIFEVVSLGADGEKGKLRYGNVTVSEWCTRGSRRTSLEETLIYADACIEVLRLHK